MRKRKGLPCPKCGQPDSLTRNGTYPNGKPKWTCKDQHGTRTLCYTTGDPSAPYRGHDGKPKRASERPKPARHQIALGGVKRMVVTWAQNSTPVHQGFLTALKAYCAEHDAQLIVIPGRYKNPTSQWTESQDNAEQWAAELTPYLHNQRKKLNANLILAADVKTQPTAVSPTTGFDALTGGESCILGHPKVQLRTVPTPQNRMPKILTTTGAITLPNYTDSSAGKKGEFHHSFGAVSLELGTKIFHLRHLSPRKDGAFIDLDRAYYPDGRAEAAPRWQAIVFGDAHYRFADPQVVAATFNELVPLLDPQVLVWHDLLDSYAVTPHHLGNPLIALAKYRAGFNDIAVEVNETVTWLRHCSAGRKAYVVPSNHDNMLARWIMSADWRADPANAEFYLETALHMARSARMEAQGATYLDPFQYWVQRMLKPGDDIHCLNGPLTIGGIELSMHGDRGPNGARGTVKNLSRLGVKVISGHGHSPAIEEGHTRTGTMTYLSLEYTEGPGSWLNAHGAIDAFDRRHLFIIVDGAFRHG